MANQAFNAKSGDLLYTLSATLASQVVANGVLYGGDWNGSSFYAYSAKDGTLLKTISTDGLNFRAAPGVVNGRVYIGTSTERLYAIGLRNRD